MNDIVTFILILTSYIFFIFINSELYTRMVKT